VTAKKLADDLITSLLQDDDPLPPSLMKEVITNFLEEHKLTKEQKLELLKEFKKADKDELSVGEVKVVKKTLSE
jgi:hypothetical protein